jgi:predicted TPR repeat methyltransferase
MNRKERREQKSKVRKSGAPHPAYAEACVRYAKGRIDEAQYYLKQVLDEEPRHADALHLLGVIALGAKRYGAAIELIGRAVAVNGNEAFYHNNLGLALMGAGDLAGAETAFARALGLKPDFPEACNNRAEILVRLDRNEEAEALAQKALALKPGFIAAHCTLAAALYGAGKKTEAEAVYRDAIKADPRSALAHHNLGRALYDRQDFEGAELHLNEYLKIDSGDRFGARVLLAAIGRGALPGQAPEAHMKHLYAQRARDWDARSTYYAHKLVAEALARHGGADRREILDAGCGTGLTGALVKPAAARLDGVDISTDMLEVAASKKIYDDLYAGDLVACLKDSAGKYGAIVSAATLIHFGDLAPVLNAAHGALKDGGLMVFTLFPAKDDGAVTAADFEGLAQGGCFAHGRGYVRRVAEAAGLETVSVDDVIHEHNNDTPIPGLVVTLRKR